MSLRFQRLGGTKDLKVALVSCPTPVLLDEKGIPYSPVRTNYFPHAQVLLSSELKQEMERRNIKGQVRVVDLKSIDDPELWRGKLTEYGEIKYGERTLRKAFIGNGMERVTELAEMHVIGLTSNFTSEANSVVEVIRRVRAVNPGALILVGGRDAQARGAFYLKNGADVVAIGDSDASFPEFICGLVEGEDGTKKRLRGNFLLPKTRGRGTAQLDFSVLDNLSRYKESGGGGFIGSYAQRPVAAYIETSRGCDRDCDFCTEALTKRANFDLEGIKRQVLNYKRNGIGILLFSDDNLLEWLNLGKRGEEALLDLFRFLRENGMVWEFSVGIEIGRFFDRRGELRGELLEILFWNNGDPTNWQGVFRLLAPFENAGEELGMYKKLRPWEDNLKVMQRIASLGVPQINLGVMFGWPTDGFGQIEGIRRKAKEIRELLGRGERISPGLNLSLFCLMPLPGTALYIEMEKAGRIKYSIEKDPELWNVFTSVIEGEVFSTERITEIRRELIAEFQSEQPDGKVKSQWQILK